MPTRTNATNSSWRGGTPVETGRSLPASILTPALRISAKISTVFFAALSVDAASSGLSGARRASQTLRSAPNVGTCHVPFFLNALNNAAALRLSCVSTSLVRNSDRYSFSSGDGPPARALASASRTSDVNSASADEQAISTLRKPALPKCSMLRCPACVASRAVTDTGRCPANAKPRRFASPAISKYASRVSVSPTLMKSTPFACKSSTTCFASASVTVRTSGGTRMAMDAARLARRQI